MVSEEELKRVNFERARVCKSFRLTTRTSHRVPEELRKRKLEEEEKKKRELAIKVERERI